MTELTAFCEKYGIPCDMEKFEQYVDLLLHFNKAMNLIGPMSKKEVFSSLIVDSLYPAVARAPEGHILDVGSGAGLPGMVLKIAYPDLPVTFVEPRKKRANFLRIASNRLELETKVEECRIEELDDAKFDYVISKAFRPPEIWVDIAGEWVSEEGVIVVMHSLPQEFKSDAIAYVEVPGAERAVSVFGQETEKPG